MGERYQNEQGGYGNYGLAYAERVKKSKRGEYIKGISYILIGVFLMPAIGLSQLMWPLVALGAITIGVGWALGNGYSNWLRVALLIGLIGGLGWFLLQYGAALAGVLAFL
jgi:hypothetical protein